MYFHLYLESLRKQNENIHKIHILYYKLYIIIYKLCHVVFYVTPYGSNRAMEA
jgi:hypothetical protein